MKTKNLVLFILFVSIATIAFICYFINYGNKYTENKYSLSELNDGVYGVYTNVSSRVPAQNYEMITLCYNRKVYTFKGYVYINYTDEEPYVIYQDYNYINGDKIYVYVPYGSIEYQVNVGV